MLQYFLFFMFVSLCASEKESVKQKEEQKFVLIEGKNTFTITKGSFPYFDQLIESFPDRPAGTVVMPIPISQHSNVNQQTIVMLYAFIMGI